MKILEQICYVFNYTTHPFFLIITITLFNILIGVTLWVNKYVIGSNILKVTNLLESLYLKLKLFFLSLFNFYLFKKIKENWSNKLIYIAIYLFILFIYYYLNNNLILSYLAEYFTIYDVIVEDAKGSLNLYYINENNKLKKLKSYPIEMFVVYDFNFHNDNVVLLKELIKSQFTNCKISVTPQPCHMWCPSHNDIPADFLRGETFNGSYKSIHNKHNITFKFVYSIQHADGFNLETIDKSWPALNRIIQKKYIKNQLILKMSLDIDTLKIRKGTITSFTQTQDDITRLIDHYNEFHKWKPSLFFATNTKSSYQLIEIDLPKGNYYIDIFFRYNKNKDIYTIDLNILKKLYRIEQVDFMKQWYIKYNKWMR